MVLVNRIEAKKLKKAQSLSDLEKLTLSSYVVICDDFRLINCLLSHLFAGVCSAFKSGCPEASDFEAKIQWPGGTDEMSAAQRSGYVSKIRISGPVRQVFKGIFYTDSME